MRVIRTVMLILAMGSPVWAQPDIQPIPWEQLNQQEQGVLQRFSSEWDRMPAVRQQRLLNGARQWSNMNSDERDQARQRFQQWQQMKPDEQARLREGFDRFRRLPLEQREAIRNARQWFRSLPPERRKEMREQWRNMSQAERREFRRQLKKEYGERHPNQGGNRPFHPKPLKPSQ